ncbi:MAG: hypothetical protein K9L68_12480 [Spirochaetales bacterium]|nr:hypothetical protein [Spirochaetales bacterium]
MNTSRIRMGVVEVKEEHRRWFRLGAGSGRCGGLIFFCVSPICEDSPLWELKNTIYRKFYPRRRKSVKHFFIDGYDSRTEPAFPWQGVAKATEARAGRRRRSPKSAGRCRRHGGRSEGEAAVAACRRRPCRRSGERSELRDEPAPPPLEKERSRAAAPLAPLG